MSRVVIIATASVVAAFVAACAGSPGQPRNGWSDPKPRPQSLLHETCITDHSTGVGLCMLRDDALASWPRFEITNLSVMGDQVVDVQFTPSIEGQRGVAISVKGIPYTRTANPLSGYAIFDHAAVISSFEGDVVEVSINGSVVGNFEPNGWSVALDSLERSVFGNRSTTTR